MKNLFLLLLFVGYSQAASACDCLMTPVRQHIKSTPYLLKGKVIAVLDDKNKEGRDYHLFLRSIGIQDTVSRGYSVKIIVQQDFKGKYKAGKIIEIHSTYSNCDMLFSAGETYILFLHKAQGNLFPTYCSYSNILDGSPASIDLVQAIRTELKSRD
ncbi:hypothetical protein Q5H92_10575 [Hymenobacter sp. M29]|uniref:Tissue inhibitor of metalloproteinase n=1 Tax=Hymenobacter mellowenesis TaxID=3063995 RepID=A0ABT9ADN3_9BACT|nr:hypothetical protein [Hymenobacter sp. M29]MDO7846802.1 hypothetical protein [Hymenobacter sp. M29]